MGMRLVEACRLGLWPDQAGSRSTYGVRVLDLGETLKDSAYILLPATFLLAGRGR